MIKLESYSLIGDDGSGKLAIAYDEEDAKISPQDSLLHRILSKPHTPDEIVFFSPAGDVLSITQDLKVPGHVWHKIISEEQIVLLCFSGQNTSSPKLERIIVSEKSKESAENIIRH